MSLLVEYTVLDGKAAAQIEALQSLVAGLNEFGEAGFNYTAFETDDPTRFIALLEFDDDAGKQRFLDSAPFALYRDGARARFPHPPKATPIRLVASTR